MASLPDAAGQAPRKERVPRKAAKGLPPGGVRRSKTEILRLTDVCEEGYLLNMSHRQLGTLLGKAAGLVDAEGKPRPMGHKMVSVYVQRVRDRHQANPLPGLEEARAQAARRYMQMITRLRSKGEADPKTILAWETRYAALMGLDAPRDKEAIQAQAQAIVQAMLEQARREKAQQQAQAEFQLEEERRRQWEEEEAAQRKMIDVAPGAPEGGRDGSDR